MASELTFDDPDKQRQYEQVDLELMRQEVRACVIWTRVGLKVVGKQFVGRHKGKKKDGMSCLQPDCKTVDRSQCPCVQYHKACLKMEGQATVPAAWPLTRSCLCFI